jgi:hypothetical protein
MRTATLHRPPRQRLLFRRGARPGNRLASTEFSDARDSFTTDEQFRPPSGVVTKPLADRPSAETAFGVRKALYHFLIAEPPPGVDLVT